MAAYLTWVTVSMGIVARKHKLKLDIMESLARSQRALAKILESVSETTDASEETAVKLRENIRVLAEYQRAIMVKMLGIEVGEYRNSGPSRPWTNDKLQVMQGWQPARREDANPIEKKHST